MWKIRHWTMIGLSSELRLGLTVEAKALKHRKIQKSLHAFASFLEDSEGKEQDDGFLG